MKADTEMLTLDDAKPLVEYEYPAVIASVFRKCRTTDSEDLGGRHKSLIDLYEVFVRFLCIVQLQELRRCVPDLKERLPQKEQTLKFLKRPSTGGWVGLLRVLCNLDFDEERTHWADKIVAWYDEGKNSESREILDLLGGIEGVRFQMGTQTPNAEICNALVSYRNKQFAHAASLREQEARKRLPKLERVLVYLLRSASFLKEIENIFVERLEVAENDQWLVHAKRLNGTSEEPAHLLASRKLPLSEVYAVRSEDGEIASKPVSLAPFILRKINPERKQPDLYVYNDAWRTKLEYLSYDTGAHYYHDELHSGFEELITLKLQRGVEEDVHRDLSSEERTQHARRYFKRAMVHREEGRFEDAIEVLEQSLEFERQPETLLEIARLQNRLGDPEVSVLQTVQHALDLRPNYEEAEDLRERIEGRTNGQDRASVQNGTQAQVHNPPSDGSPEFSLSASEIPVIGEAFLPPSVRPHAKSVFFVFFFVWYGLSASVEYAVAGWPLAASRGVQFVLATLVALGGFTARDRLVDLKSTLSLQLDSMRLERFESWYDEQLKRTFGRFRFRDDGHLQWIETLRQEKALYVLQVGLVVAGVTAAYYLSSMSEVENAGVVLKRIVDYAILGMWVVPGVRLVFMTSNLIVEFSSLSLKPSLTKMQNEGLRAFGPMLVFYTGGAVLIFISIISMSLLAGQIDTFYKQFTELIFYMLPVFLFVTWSVGMPLLLHYAMRQSKRKAINRYVSHIEKAFNAFLNDPDERSLERYQWLMRHRDTIDRVVTWPLSIWQTLAIVLFHLLMLASLALFIMYRAEYLWA